MAEPEDALGLASEEDEEESVEVVQAARPRAMEPTAAAAKIRPMGRIGLPFVGLRGHFRPSCVCTDVGHRWVT